MEKRVCITGIVSVILMVGLGTVCGQISFARQQEYPFIPEDEVAYFKVHVGGLRMFRASWRGIPIISQVGEIYYPSTRGYLAGRGGLGPERIRKNKTGT